MTARTTARLALPAFVITLAPGAFGQCLTQEFQGNQTGYLDRFGSSVNIDGVTAVIGSLTVQEAYVFKRTPGGWDQEKRLSVSDPQPNGGLGREVDVSGSFVVAGAGNRDEGSEIDAGAAYIFDETDDYSQVAKLLPGTSVAGERFGASVAIDGDTVAVGAPGATANAGRIHVFERSGTDWLEEASFQVSGAQPNLLAGEAGALALDGDLLVVGTVLGEAAYVFSRTPMGWTEIQTLVASDGEPSDRFGSKVAIDGDVILLGAPGDRSNRGSAYLFERSGNVFVEVQKIFPVTGQQQPQMFGSGVDVQGGIALVGAPGEGPRGAAYLFERDMTQWEGTRRLDKGGPAQIAAFGTSVAIGGSHALVTAPLESLVGPANSGTAVSFDLDGPGQVTRYCASGTNSSGREAKIRATGTLGISANDFRLRAVGAMPNQFGVFCYAALQDQMPFGDGFICLQPPFFRLWPIQVTNANGNTARTVDFGAPPANAGQGEITAGSTWNFQFWYRDPGSDGAGFNMSNGVNVTFCP